MRNVTITLDEQTARWLRLEAAGRDMSMSRLVSDILRERMTASFAYEIAMSSFLERKPRKLRAGKPLPAREELHDRNGLR